MEIEENIMTFIQTQKLVHDENGNVIGGYATVSETIYDPENKARPKHKTIAKLGKIIYLSKDKKSGIFFSSIRGLFEYDVLTNEYSTVSNDDERLGISGIQHQMRKHTVFGDVYLILKILEKLDLLRIFKGIFL